MTDLKKTIALWLAGALLWAPLPLYAEGEAVGTEPAVADQKAPPTGESVEAVLEETQEGTQEEASDEQPEGSFSPFGGQVPADQQIQPGPGGINEKVSLDLRNIEVTDALRYLAQKGGLNMAISKDVKGRVQLLLNDVSIKDILDLILITNGLASEKIGDVIYVMSEAEYKERFGRKFSDTRQVKMFRLKYAVPEQAFALLEVLKSEIGRLLVDPESGTVLVMDSPTNIERMEKALESLEQRKNVKVYSLRYAKAADVETKLKTQLDNKKVGLISADERTNQLIVETLPQRMEDIDRLVEALDQKTREVLIDAKIIKVTISDDYHGEIKWEGLLNRAMKSGTAFVANHPFSPVFRAGESFVDDFAKIAAEERPTAGSKSTLTENLFLGNIDKDDAFEVLINFLKTIGETKILANPKLAIVNNQEAKIHVGEKQAYVTTTTTTGSGGTSTQAEQVTFVYVGIQLAVTPTINEDGFVTMKIKPEISSVTDFLITPTENKIPIIDSSLAETTVMVKDGSSIVIGGLRRDEKVSTHKKIPGLGDLPLIGKPFNSKTDKVTHTELLILLTPHIMYGDKLVTGYREAADAPFMSYMDYTSLNEADKKEPPAIAIPAGGVKT